MKKRIFIPCSIGFLLLETFLLALSIIMLIIFILPYFGIDLSSKSWELYEDILFAIAIIFLLYSSIRFLLAFKIHLRKEDIATFGDGLPKFEKIQYKCFVKYTDIQNIAIVASEKNSKNHRIQLRFVSSSMPKKYLEFTLINGKKNRMCINYYTKKQITKMLNYINLNMQLAGNENSLNVEEIMKDWYSYGGYNREDLKIKRGEKIRKKSKISINNDNIDVENNDKDKE